MDPSEEEEGQKDQQNRSLIGRTLCLMLKCLDGSLQWRNTWGGSAGPLLLVVDGFGPAHGSTLWLRLFSLFRLRCHCKPFYNLDFMEGSLSSIVYWLEMTSDERKPHRWNRSSAPFNNHIQLYIWGKLMTFENKKTLRVRFKKNLMSYYGSTTRTSTKKNSWLKNDDD